MKTVVYQSYRTTDVAPWISRCLDSVKSWATLQGFDYYFVDDKFFSYLPADFSERVNLLVQPMSDLARLLVAKELLCLGYDRTVWIDADVVIFSPEKFLLNIDREFAFGREIWIAPDHTGKLVSFRRIHNAITVFMRENSFLDFYINACLRKVEEAPLTDCLGIGTKFLTSIYNAAPFPLINDVGMLSPTMLQAIDQRKKNILRQYRALHGAPLYAANLCGSLIDKAWFGRKIEQKLYDRVIDILLETEGNIFA